MMDKSSYTKFEMTRIVSARALQIAQGSPPMVAMIGKEFDPVELAMREWDAGVVPIDIKGKGSNDYNHKIAILSKK